MSDAPALWDADQPRLFDEARTRRDVALAQVEANADEGWTDEAYAFIERYAHDHQVVFCDDLWEAGLRAPREMRALGPVFRRLSRNGVIVKTGRSKPSVRSNLTDKPIWRSLIWDAR